jgi:aspartyl-tRNA(Asn)/glutamyl-tRNA(Gln) amidotransferase subunit A
VPQEYFVSGLQAEVEAGVREAIRLLESLGAELQEVSLPRTTYLHTYLLRYTRILQGMPFQK